MNRLTEKREKPLITGNEEIIEYRLVRSYDSCINKLGKLEDLEEQLGCPLEVVAHLVMNKPFYYEDGYGRMHFIQGYELCTCSLLFGNTWEDVDIYVGENGDIEIPLSEYKKSFWLKEDKSE